MTTAAVLLTGCGADDPDETNTADTTYAASVVSHHAQTLALLDLTVGRDDLDPRVGAFADQARGELFAEVGATEKRLEAWGEQVPKTALQHTHDDSVTYDTSIPGVLSTDEVRTLEAKKGPRFLRAWLAKLITHEQGAAELAGEAVDDGQNTAAVAVAKDDERAHLDRIAALRKLAAPG